MFYAVGLTRWFTTELDENMEVQIKWPPTSVDAGSLVRKEKSPDPNWKEETALVKRFYGKWFFLLEEGLTVIYEPFNIIICFSNSDICYRFI